VDSQETRKMAKFSKLS